MFRHPTAIRFAHVDAAGILYFSRAFELCHEAYEAMLDAAGMPLRGLFETSPWLLPLVHAEADYVAPMRLGDRVTVEVAVDGVGESSVRIAFRLVGDDGVLRATVRHVHVAVDRATFAKRAVPVELVAAMRRATG